MKNIALAAVAALSLAACDPNLIRPDVQRVDPKTGQVQTLTSAKEVESGILRAFPDIPVPAGHSIDLERTTIFTSNNQSLGKIVAEGRADIISLYRFYETAMPQNGWTLVNAFQSSTSSMYYAKPGRFVAIIMENVGRVGTTRVTLNIGPE